MATLLVRDVDADLYERLKKRAQHNRRSTPAEVKAIIAASLNDDERSDDKQSEEGEQTEAPARPRRTALELMQEIWAKAPELTAEEQAIYDAALVSIRRQ